MKLTGFVQTILVKHHEKHLFNDLNKQTDKIIGLLLRTSALVCLSSVTNGSERCQMKLNYCHFWINKADQITGESMSSG